MSSSTPLVPVHDENAVRLIRMNRADKKNALTGEMYAAMADALAGANKRSDIRCVVIAGAPGVFCAGNDLQDFLRAAEDDEGLSEPIMRFLYALAGSRKPLVAAVQGAAIGIGTTMLLHCDYVVAANDARFATPFVSLGLVPEAGSSLLAPRLMGQRHAFALLAMGEPLDSESAKTCGLVNRIVPAADVDAEAMKAAQKIASLPPEAVLATRQLMRGAPEDILARIDEEADFFKVRLQSDEAKAAFEAFFARKK
ncbi:MAG: crotonase/enoyl-CoA hydratase family protein [Pseudorhodoplanes sp.]|nr:crotonase/enoyl-CoA hydratase family protein [Pseudorhodoplanes sp.]